MENIFIRILTVLFATANTHHWLLRWGDWLSEEQSGAGTAWRIAAALLALCSCYMMWCAVDPFRGQKIGLVSPAAETADTMDDDSINAEKAS